MQINLISENNNRNWNQFLAGNNGRFLQSFEWGQFQKKSGKKIWRFKVQQEEEVLAEAQMIKEHFYLKSLKLPLCFFYIPFGPVFKAGLSSHDKENAFNLILREAHTLAKGQRAVFLRIEPIVPLHENKFLTDAVKRVQPQKTLILGLEKSEENMLKNLKYRTRYNIRLAPKKGVILSLIHNPGQNLEKYTNIFFELLSKTAQRQEFSTFPKKHYQGLLNINSQDFKVKLFLAEYKGKVIVANIVFFFGKMASHVHGCSDYKHRALKAANFLQWEQIMEAKKQGCLNYDFWGIDKEKYPGVTSFKKSFGGQELIYPDSKDIVFKKNWHEAYKKLRKFI